MTVKGKLLGSGVPNYVVRLVVGLCAYDLKKKKEDIVTEDVGYVYM